MSDRKTIIQLFIEWLIEIFHVGVLYFPTYDDPLGQVSVLEKYQKSERYCVLLIYAMALLQSHRQLHKAFKYLRVENFDISIEDKDALMESITEVRKHYNSITPKGGK